MPVSPQTITMLRDFIESRHAVFKQKWSSYKGWFKLSDKGGIHLNGSRYVMSFITSDVEFLKSLKAGIPESTIIELRKSIHIRLRWRLAKHKILLEVVESMIPHLHDPDLAEWYKHVLADMYAHANIYSGDIPLLKLPQRPSPFALWRIKNGLSQGKAAEMLGCKKTSLLNVEHGVIGVNPYWSKRLSALTKDPDMGDKMRQWRWDGKSLIPPPYHFVFDELIPNFGEEPAIDIPEDRLRAIRYGAKPRPSEVEDIAHALGWKPDALQKVFDKATAAS